MKNSKITILGTALIAFASFTFSSCEKELDLKEPGNLVPKTVEQDASLPAISVNNTKLHSEALGNPNSPMIVVLHGGPGEDYRSMLNCKDLVNDGYYVVFYDQRGSGLSKREPKSIYTTQIMFDDLASVISHYRSSPTQKIFLFGHSWGAMLATGYINQNPNAINGVVLAEPGGFTFDDVKDYVGRTRDMSPFNELTNDVFYPDQFLTGKEDEHEVLDYKMSLNAAQGFEAVGDNALKPFWRHGAIVNTALFEIADREGLNWTTNLNQYNTKVLFVYSEKNPAYGLDHALKVSAAYPNVQLNRINGCGHEMIQFGWNNLYPLALSYFNSLN